MIAIIISICLVRLVQGKSLLPGGHHLVLKTIVFAALFMIYTNMVWSARQSFCVRMSGVVEELRSRVKEQAVRAHTDAQMRRAGICVILRRTVWLARKAKTEAAAGSYRSRNRDH